MKHAHLSPQHMQSDIRPTARERRWFALIDRHGPLSSEVLYEATRDTHRCKDTALRRLQVLREAGFLRLPPQQRHIAKADFNPYVYDLTARGWTELAAHQESERHCRPTGHWWHGSWVSAVSSVIEVEAAKMGITYVPAARILALRDVELGIPVSGSKVIPDQLFALKYPDGYRSFALEVDRGTEPVRSSAARKSLKRSVAQYREVLQERTYQQHYGLKSNLAVLWVFNSARRQKQFMELLQPGDRAIFAQCILQDMPRVEELTSAVRGAWMGIGKLRLGR